MQKVILKPLQHREQECIGIYFENNSAINNAIRQKAAAKEKAEILKPGSMHALRHNFATHLLDKGTDVTLIMKLLGHNDIKTTLRYLHVTNRDMLQIISPLDDLNLE